MLSILLKLIGVKSLLGFSGKALKIAFLIISFPIRVAYKFSLYYALITAGVMFILGWAFLLYFVQGFHDNTPWQNMENYATLSTSTREELIEMGMIAAHAYDDTYCADLERAGYRQFSKRLSEDGLNYVTMTRGGKLYIGFRGTYDEADIMDDILISASDSVLERFSAAARIVEKNIANHSVQEVIVTGHSLGGSVVQYIVWWFYIQKRQCPFKLRAYTFNPFAFPCGKGVTRVPGELLTDVVQESDIAQTVRQKNRVVGRGILVKGKYNAANGSWEEAGFFSLHSQHSIFSLIENMKAQNNL